MTSVDRINGTTLTNGYHSDSEEDTNGLTELGLTTEEYRSVKKTWELVGKNLKQNGVDIFVALFTAYPEYQNLFDNCRGIPLDVLATSSNLKAHGSTFMHGLSAFIDNLDDKETLVHLIESNTERHFKRKITFQHFESAFTLIAGFLRGRLGNKMDPLAISGWQKLITIMKSVIKNKLDEINSKGI